jgi:aminoglycoside phosphotransferase (APT) family kinase protein
VSSEVEIPLAGGDVTEGVVRVGDTVRRPHAPWSSSVAAYLRHLERVGFGGAPRYLGVDKQGRDMLEFVEGDVPGQPVVEPWAGTDAALVGVARLLRRLHDASAGFAPPADATWFGEDVVVELPSDLPGEPPADVISHFDVTPQNVVFRGGEPVALIDFDLTRPGARLRDVVQTAVYWVQLVPPGDRHPAFARGDVPARLAAFVDTYGLDGDERARFCDVAIHGATRSWHKMKANAAVRGGGWARMWADGVGDLILRRRAWLVEERPMLETALGVSAADG